jgi:hypothetical protein
MRQVIEKRPDSNNDLLKIRRQRVTISVTNVGFVSQSDNLRHVVSVGEKIPASIAQRLRGSFPRR